LQAFFLGSIREVEAIAQVRQARSTRGGTLKALEEGAYIKHFQYGLGVVTESNSERTSIDFDVHGMKKFVTSIMVVDAAEGTPPRRRRSKKAKKPIPAVPALGLAAGAK
jgi:hypothetical protein